jgi:energy-coupling factor transporter ATP-binding protein EcfA2
MLDTTAATELIAYLQKFAANGKTLVMFEHRHEYLDNLPELHHIALSGKERETDFPSANLSARENFKLNIDQLHVQLGKREVIQNLDLEINSGQIVAIVGRNGVGKTTLLRSLAGLQKHGGSVKVNTAHGDETPNFGMAFQNPDLQMFNASVRDEMLYRLPNPDLNYFRWLISALGLERYENTPPLLLSEGEKKRVALGLVLMRQPAHGLLLDEPSLGQDQLHKTILIRLLRTLADAGQLVVMTTHDLTLASHADRLILLGPGCEVIADGLTDAVLNDSAAWQKSGILLPHWFLRGRAETQ